MKRFALVVLTFSSFGLALVAGNLLDSRSNWGLALFPIALILLIAGILALESIGEGTPKRALSLKTNEIYETIGEVVNGDIHYAILRHRNGDVRAYRLDMTPPPVFKWMDDKPVTYPAPHEVSATG